MANSETSATPGITGTGKPSAWARRTALPSATSRTDTPWSTSACLSRADWAGLRAASTKTMPIAPVVTTAARMPGAPPETGPKDPSQGRSARTAKTIVDHRIQRRATGLSGAWETGIF